MNVKNKLNRVAVLLATIALVACDAEQKTLHNPGQVSLEVPHVQRTTLDAEAGNLSLSYQVRVNGIEVESGNFTGAQGYRISVDAVAGDNVYYRFLWQETDFFVNYATAEDTITIGDPINVTPVYDYEYDDDRDGFTNRQEIDAGYSPISDKDMPDPATNRITPADSRRTFITNYAFDVPVFGCNNSLSGGTNNWYWLLENDGSLSGVELDTRGVPAVFSNQGTYEMDSNNNSIKIANERNDIFVWELQSDTQYLRVTAQVDSAGVSSPISTWGHCVKIDGPNLVL